MIGPTPSQYRRRPEHEPTTGQMEATYREYVQQDLPSSTVPSAAHSQSQYPPTLDSANFGVFETSGGHSYPHSSSVTQVHRELVPGAGGGTSEWYQQQQGLNDTHFSDHSDLSAAGTVGRPLLIGSRPVHKQYLAPPNEHPRPTEEPEEVGVTGGDDEAEPDAPAGKRGQTQRLPGACRHCKRLKMKCIFEEHANTCQRCEYTNKVCTVEGRKRGRGPNKRELLMRELASKDQLIDSLLRQIHNPAMRTPINWPPTVPAPQQSSTDRPPDRDIVAWIESTRQYKPSISSASIDANTSRSHVEDIVSSFLSDECRNLL